MRPQALAVPLFLLTFVPVLLAQSSYFVPSASGVENPLLEPGSVGLTFHKQVQEVSLVLSVTDHRGHFVKDLRPNDLTIFDNGNPQDGLTFFQSQTDLPLHVAIVVDISSSVASRFEAEQDTIQEFLQNAVRPSDSVSLFAFNQNVQLQAPVTNNWKDISRKVKKLKPGGDTALYDAVSVASQWLGSDGRPARRIMILITDGEENQSKTTLEASISEALKAESVIYAVNANEHEYSNEAKAGETTLRRMADATGGSYFHAGSYGVGRAFGKIRRELRSQYAVAYKPSNLADQLFHRIFVTAPRNLRVRCRTGYYVK
jgi:Ca-activated chloride channel family protein